MKIDRCAVLRWIQRAAASPPTDMATVRLVRCHTLTRAGDSIDSTSTAARAGLGQLRIAHAARIATATHMTWKYLFMSKTMAPATNRLGTRNSATTQATRNSLAGMLPVIAAHAA